MRSASPARSPTRSCSWRTVASSRPAHLERLFNSPHTHRTAEFPAKVPWTPDKVLLKCAFFSRVRWWPRHRRLRRSLRCPRHLRSQSRTARPYPRRGRPGAGGKTPPDFNWVVPGSFTVAVAAAGEPPLGTYATDAATVVGADPDIAWLVADKPGSQAQLLVPVAWGRLGRSA